MKITQHIPYYVVKKGKYGYWQPTKSMRAAGFSPVRCGLDGPEARHIAQSWNLRWQKHRESQADGSVQNASGSRLGFVYFAFVGTDVKVGFSARPLSRINALATGMSTVPRMIVAIRGRVEHEARIHSLLHHHRKAGEWFAANSVVTRFVMRCAAFESLDHALANEPKGEQKVGTVPTFEHDAPAQISASV